MIEMDGAGNSLRTFVYGPGADEPLVWGEGGAPRLLHADERGSIIAVADANGNLIAANSYDEYGTPGSANSGRFQYTGQAWLAEIGLYYYKARMYSPTLGRFMQTDPIGYSDGPNWYAYAHNDPVNGIDPLGLCEGGERTNTCTQPYNPYEDELFVDNYGANASDSEVVVHGCRYGGTYPLCYLNVDLSTLPLQPSFHSNPNRGTGDGGDSNSEKTKEKPTPSRVHCLAFAGLDFAASSTLDAAGLIPGEAAAAAFTRLGADSIQIARAVATGKGTDLALEGGGTTLEFVEAAVVNERGVIAKGILESLPIINDVVVGVSIIRDAHSAMDKFRQCMAGK